MYIALPKEQLSLSSCTQGPQWIFHLQLEGMKKLHHWTQEKRNN